MTSEQFLQEVLNSPNCPEDFEKIYEEFRKYQKAAMDTLIEFHRVCELNHINYQLAFGSLLGAIRDGGQIPWDYDIDVFVPYDEKMQLIEVLKRDLNDQFYFYCPEVDKKCRHVIMRLAPKGYRTEALHVDVFYYIGTPNDAEERKQYAQKIKNASLARYWKLINPKEEALGSLRKFLGLCKGKFGYIRSNLSAITEEYSNLCTRYSEETSDYVISADSFSDWYDFPSSLFKETQLYTTENGSFRISTRYKELLTIMYKDYQKVPALDKRIQEVLSNYNRLRCFEQRM